MNIWILSPLQKRCQSSDPDQILMKFRKECFVNLNIWACDRKHAKHQYCRISDFVVQKPMRMRSISKYHFQHRYMIFFEIKRDSYASASLSPSLSLSLSLYHLISKFENSLDADLQRLVKPNQGQTGIIIIIGIPRINNVIERTTLRPMPRKNIIQP